MHKDSMKQQWMLPILETLIAAASVVGLTWALTAIAASRGPEPIRANSKGIVSLLAITARTEGDVFLTSNTVSDMSSDTESHRAPEDYDYWYGRDVLKAEEERSLLGMTNDGSAVSWAFHSPPMECEVRVTYESSTEVALRMQAAGGENQAVLPNTDGEVEEAVVAILNFQGQEHTFRLGAGDQEDPALLITSIRLVPIDPDTSSK